MYSDSNSKPNPSNLLSNLKDLNDISSIIYKNTLKSQITYIDNKLKQTKIKYLHNHVKLMGTQKEIYNICSDGCRNLIQSFFKYTNDKCVVCNIKKSNSVQLERAHYNNNFGRKYILEKVIDNMWKNNNSPLVYSDIMMQFIIFHKKHPIYLLCKKCHYTYDNQL